MLLLLHKFIGSRCKFYLNEIVIWAGRKIFETQNGYRKMDLDERRFLWGAPSVNNYVLIMIYVPLNSFNIRIINWNLWTSDILQQLCFDS